MPTIILRKVTIDDLALLLYWEKQPHVVTAGVGDWQWETEIYKPSLHQEWLISEVNGRPVGFVQIIDPALEESHYWGDVPENLRAIDIWIGEPDALGRGYGTAIMTQAIDRCFADPAVTAILIDPLAANTRAHAFYQRLGFQFLERRLFDQDDTFVFRLTREKWDARSAKSDEDR